MRLILAPLTSVTAQQGPPERASALVGRSTGASVGVLSRAAWRSVTGGAAGSYVDNCGPLFVPVKNSFNHCSMYLR